MKRIYTWEPWFFIFFGLFHIHRIWALIDRETYASFWMGIMEKKGLPYFLIMGILAGLCVLGIITFIREWKGNYLWRWIYVFGGIYVLFDLFAIAIGLEAWQKLLGSMFDIISFDLVKSCVLIIALFKGLVIILGFPSSLLIW